MNPLDHIVNANLLLRRNYPEPSWLIPGLLPPGLTLLAGKPKTGKSWWALQIATELAEQGKDVLYLALEDPERRLQERLTMFLDTDQGPPHLWLVGQGIWPRLDQDGLQYLREWMIKYPSTCLIIIDTLAKVKPRSKSGGNQYDDDYASLNGLKKLADEFNIGILIVHHLRKMPDLSDPFNEISGTSAITGCADTMMVLKRGRQSDKAELFVTGRDIENQQLRMEWNPEDCHWKVATNQHVETTPVGLAIIEFLKTQPNSCNSKAILDALVATYPAGTIKSQLSRQVKNGTLLLENHMYLLPPSISHATMQLCN